jgi:hypothetical protein
MASSKARPSTSIVRGSHPVIILTVFVKAFGTA